MDGFNQISQYRRIYPLAMPAAMRGNRFFITNRARQQWPDFGLIGHSRDQVSYQRLSLTLAGNRFVANALRFGAFFAQALALVGFIFLIITRKKGHLRIAFKGQDMRGNAVQEPAIV